MSYDEFLEALAACAMFKIPDPFVSTASKVQKFILKTVIPNAKLRR